jgi:hypothetical protein
MQKATPVYKGIALNDAHDIFAEGGTLAMVEGSEAVGQLVKVRLQTYYGEWFIDRGLGVQWVQQILVRPFDPVVADALIKDAVLGTLGVVQMVSFDMEVRDGRRELAVIRSEVETIYDDVIEVGI